MSGFGRLKSMGLLSLLVWLLSFQTYHVITEHSELLLGKHHSCAHHHDSDDAKATSSSEEDDDCQICKLVSLPFVTANSLELDIEQPDFMVQSSGIYLESSNQIVFYSRGQRGPPMC